jgi:hypothetical protein
MAGGIFYALFFFFWSIWEGEEGELCGVKMRKRWPSFEDIP